MWHCRNCTVKKYYGKTPTSVCGHIPEDIPLANKVILRETKIT